MINDYRDCRSRFNLNAYMVAVQNRFDLANLGFVFPANFNSYIRQQRFSRNGLEKLVELP